VLTAEMREMLIQRAAKRLAEAKFSPLQTSKLKNL